MVKISNLLQQKNILMLQTDPGLEPDKVDEKII